MSKSSPCHLIFYDGKCGLCDQIVQRLLVCDKKRCFAFAPLQGKTAAAHLQKIPKELINADSMILIENFNSNKPRVHIRGKAAFRTLWLLGGHYRSFGWPYFLPAILYNWGYDLVAKHRRRLLPQNRCVLPPPTDSERFLR